MGSDLITNEWLRTHFKETSFHLNDSPMYMFDIQLRNNLYDNRKLQLMDLGDGYRVWYYCSITHGKDTTYFSAPIKDIKTTFELYELTSCFTDESNALHPTPKTD